MVEFEDTEAAAAAEAVREVAEGHQPKDGAMTWGSSSSKFAYTGLLRGCYATVGGSVISISSVALPADSFISW